MKLPKMELTTGKEIEERAKRWRQEVGKRIKAKGKYWVHDVIPSHFGVRRQRGRASCRSHEGVRNKKWRGALIPHSPAVPAETQ